MKILFLDIDGVLNSRNWVIKQGRKFDHPQNQIDPDAVARLNKITEATGAHIVVSSTWRFAFTHHLDKLQDLLAGHGITAPVIGMTHTHGPTRSDEIQDWLDAHPEVTKFTILDDDTLKGPLDNQVVRTTFTDGLMDTHIQMAIDRLQS